MPIDLPPDLEPLATDVALRTIGASPELVLNQLREAIREFCTRSTAWREYLPVTTVAGVQDYPLRVPYTEPEEPEEPIGYGSFALNGGGAILLNGGGYRRLNPVIQAIAANGGGRIMLNGGGYRLLNVPDPIVAPPPAPTPLGPTGAIAVWVLNAQREGIPLGKWSPPYGGQTLRAASRRGPPTAVGSPGPGTLRVWPTPDQAYTLDIEVAVSPDALDLADVPFPPGFLMLHHDAIVAGALARLYMMPNTPFAAPGMVRELAKAFSRGIASARVATEAGNARGLQPVMPFPRPAGSLPS